MTKKTIIFNIHIKQGYIEAEGEDKDTTNKVLQEYALKAIKKRLKWFSELTDEELLKYCEIETDELYDWEKRQQGVLAETLMGIKIQKVKDDKK